MNGEPAPIGTTITALIDGEECGSVTTTAEGWYGGTSILEGQHLIVSGTSDQINRTIIFMIEGIRAENTAVFTPGTASLLDLAVVTPELTANFTGNTTAGMKPLTVQFTDTSVGTVTQWNWSFGDGIFSNEQNPSHTYTTEGMYTVTLDVTDGYSSAQKIRTDYITVYPELTANFTGNTTAGMKPLTVQFTDTSVGTVTQWNWSFGDGNVSNEQNPSHTYTTEGMYTVTLDVTDGHTSAQKTRTDYITVYPELTADFSSNTTAGIQPLSVQFTDTSVGTVTQWNWSFGDGNVSNEQNPLYVYNEVGLYNVSLTVYDLTSSSTKLKTGYILVSSGPLPVAAFKATPSAGEAPLAVKFTDTSTRGPILSWQWTFGDGGTSTEQNPSHLFTKPGEYLVNLTVANIYGNNVTGKTVTVTDSTPPTFEITTGTNFTISTINLSAIASESLIAMPTVTVIKNSTTPVPVTNLGWNPVTRTYTGSISIANLSSGNHSYAITFTGKDLYSNTGTGRAANNVSIRAIVANTSTNVYTKDNTSVDLILNTSVNASVSITEYAEPENVPEGNVSIAALSIDVDDTTRNSLSNVTIRIPFTPADVEGTTGDLNTILKIYYYDTVTSQWIVLDSTVYGDRTSGGYVEAVVNHLTVFSLMTAQGPFSLSNIVPTPATYSAVVTWTTNKAATSKIYWGQSAAYSASFASGTQKLSHSVTLTGLNASTVYHYKVESYNASTATTINSTDLTFTTLAVPSPSSGGGGGGGSGGSPSGFMTFESGQIIYETTGSLSLNWNGYVDSTTRIETVDGDISVIVPAGIKAKNAEGGDLNSITVQAVGDLPAPAEGFTFAGKAVQCTPEGATFDPAVKISFELTEEEWAALGPDQTFTVMVYNNGAGQWEEIPTTILSGSRRVLGDVSHFSTYGLFITGTNVQQGTAVPTVVPTAVPTGTQTETATPGFGISVAILSLGAVGLFFLRRK